MVRIRRAQPEDRDELLEGFSHLSERSRHLRFFSATPRLTEALLKQLTSLDDHEHIAVAAETMNSESGPVRGLGVARFIRSSDDPSVAEFAVTVIDERQHQGLGGVLVLYLAAEAERNGIEVFVASVLAENHAMLALIHGMAPRASATLEEGVEHFEIRLGDLLAMAAAGRTGE